MKENWPEAVTIDKNPIIIDEKIPRLLASTTSRKPDPLAAPQFTHFLAQKSKISVKTDLPHPSETPTIPLTSSSDEAINYKQLTSTQKRKRAAEYLIEARISYKVARQQQALTRTTTQGAARGPRSASIQRSTIVVRRMRQYITNPLHPQYLSSFKGDSSIVPVPLCRLHPPRRHLKEVLGLFSSRFNPRYTQFVGRVFDRVKSAGRGDRDGGQGWGSLWGTE
jgi:hypothetical protein